MPTMSDDLPTRMAFLEALKRAEALAQELARTANQAAVSGRVPDLEAACRAIESHKRAREFREQVEKDLAQPRAA